MISLAGKSILITGASSGIGRACAVRCAELGARVALVARREDKLHETADAMTGDGHQLFPSDITQLDQLETLSQKMVDAMGPVSGFVHAAGISTRLPLKSLRPEHWQESFTINATSAFELTRHLQRRGRFPEGGASHVYIGSVMASLGQPAKAAYCASKAALLNGARALALELAPRKIRVNVVSPGAVRTDMYESLRDTLPADAHEQVVKSHPLGIGEPGDVASAVAFLISDHARWITGANLMVDGGYSAQ
jgi:NAD(P)-dependent dehydrogenase (short-subunit alcohol dehydrogenase family)